MYNETFLRRAIAISAEALKTPGTEPFGAVIVKDGKIVGEGINRSVMNHDPTSHGETEAIRDACRNLETVDLRGCQLYSSCEPCALCVAAMNIAGITALYYAADMAQAGDAIADLPEAARFPVDVDRLTHECGHAVTERLMPSEQHLDAEATQILQDWASFARAQV
ncbi:nucleoside deaminase [Oceanicola sp. D3]|uniref:nucleoside deaminase n=1 Tax=Oceanicola sp. D3 TaxID=2587163 RepID=UPI001120395E|nr:nucleoside deaminase [Oceanicola sp. D3]QDC10775.1 nucleoside deaminase [Oceanicola sp. D3]